MRTDGHVTHQSGDRRGERRLERRVPLQRSPLVPLIVLGLGVFFLVVVVVVVVVVATSTEVAVVADASAFGDAIVDGGASTAASRFALEVGTCMRATIGK